MLDDTLLKAGNSSGRSNRRARGAGAAVTGDSWGAADASQTRSVLIYRIGSLGDTIVSLPSLWAVREHFPRAFITMLCDDQPRKEIPRAPDLLSGSGIVDEFITYPGFVGSRLRRIRAMLGLLVKLRLRGFQTLVYLAPSLRSRTQVERDRKFFTAAGIKTILGMERGFGLPSRVPGAPMPELAREADLLMGRLAASGIAVPASGKGRMDLGLGAREEDEVRRWRETLPADGGRPWIAVGPGSKMPAKRWPASRFQAVVARLIEARDVWPVVFGGPEDREVGQQLVRDWGRGHCAAGELGLRASALAMQPCRLYLGNDTGTMHMAVTFGIRCVALFSSRSYVGLWYPYGQGHRVLRTSIDCEGCGLLECIDREMECLMRIGVDEVYLACVDLLDEVHQGAEAPRVTVTG